MVSILRRALAKAKAAVEGVSFDNLWEPSKPNSDVSDSIYTEETKKPDKKYGKVWDIGDIDESGKVPNVIKKGLEGASERPGLRGQGKAAGGLASVGRPKPPIIKKGLAQNVGDAIKDLREAAAVLSEIGDSLDNVGKATACKSCGGKVSMEQRSGYRKSMSRRGWTPESHSGFWSTISAGSDKGDAGGHRACVARMDGKVADPHGFCAWAENEATGEWPDEHKLEGAVRGVREASAEVSKQATILRKAMRGSN